MKEHCVKCRESPCACIAMSRTPTKPMPPARVAQIEVDLVDTTACGEFFALVSRLLLGRKRVRVSIEVLE